MDLNAQKQQFSIAYVYAVAAVARLKVLRTDVDDDSIDVGLERSGGYAPKLDLQLKCTADPLPTSSAIPFPLKLKNYDDLRRRTVVPRWLVTLFVPPACADWLTISIPPAEVLLRRVAWWVSLVGEPDEDNTSSVTVYFPRSNVFTPASVNAKLDEVESLYRPV